MCAEKIMRGILVYVLVSVIKARNLEMPYKETVSFEDIYIQKYKFHL